MKKLKFPAELCYLVGILLLAFGAVLMTKADLGVSMVIAPAFLLYLKLSATWSFITFGIAEYMTQAFVLLLLIIVLKKFRWYYLFSFVTAFFYGLVLDLLMKLPISCDTMSARIIVFILSVFACTLGVAFIFHTYIAPEVYELFIKELSLKFGWKISRVKTCYDCSSCLIAMLMSFAFFGLFHFEGVKFGTVICALVSGKLVGIFGTQIDHFLDVTPIFQKQI
ncbi:MAG: DUF6198 family protein [Evtepia sp.]